MTQHIANSFAAKIHDDRMCAQNMTYNPFDIFPEMYPREPGTIGRMDGYSNTEWFCNYVILLNAGRQFVPNAVAVYGKNDNDDKNYLNQDGSLNTQGRVFIILDDKDVVTVINNGELFTAII